MQKQLLRTFQLFPERNALGGYKEDKQEYVYMTYGVFYCHEA